MYDFGIRDLCDFQVILMNDFGVDLLVFVLGFKKRNIFDALIEKRWGNTINPPRTNSKI